MRQIIWTNFAISELKNIYLYYRMVASEKVADKIRKSIFDSTRHLSKQPLIGAIEENLINLKQGHRYLIEGNYKIIYKVLHDNIYITDIFDCRQNPQKMKKRN
ncbi:MAG: type II toxin-antitoxin system RelE/ParE family toxin [Bacteroidia bacterium]|nr:type II toxin-antitoxin system RelE/ParE family toxin [Sphingobacteriaceae bacterium]MBP9068968.1 type II toxin-antitoxin system RelE/ParE family toxin [Bacteroidia bacterium]